MVRCGGRGEGLEGSMVASGARRAGPVGSVDWGRAPGGMGKQVPVLQSELGKGSERRGGGPSPAEPCCPAGAPEPCGRAGVPLTPPPPTDLDPAGLGLGAGGTVLPTPVLSSGQRAGQSRCFPHGRASCLPDLLLTSRGHPTSAQPRQPHLALTLPFRDRHGGGWSVLGLAR